MKGLARGTSDGTEESVTAATAPSSSGTGRRMSLAARAVCLLVRGYQLTLSHVLGGQCRFSPSCSNYMLEAVRRHGVLFGVLLGTRRILRCHPWNPGGFDPVPEIRPRLREVLLGRKKE